MSVAGDNIDKETTLVQDVVYIQDSGCLDKEEEELFNTLYRAGDWDGLIDFLSQWDYGSGEIREDPAPSNYMRYEKGDYILEVGDRFNDVGLVKKIRRDE